MLKTQLQNALIWLRNTIFDTRYWPESKQEFQLGLASLTTISNAVDLIFQYGGQGFYKHLKPNQDHDEILTLVEKVAAISPKVIVEIGTRSGGTLFLWSQCSPLLELLVSIDLPGGIHGGGYPTARAKLYKEFVNNHPGCSLELLRVDSQTETTKAHLENLLKGRAIDFLFIDGDHRYPGVKRDYELYANLVRPGGLIAFHDIRPNTKDDTIQVFRLWNEIKTERPTVEEIVHEPYTGKYGIGLIRN